MIDFFLYNYRMSEHTITSKLPFTDIRMNGNDIVLIDEKLHELGMYKIGDSKQYDELMGLLLSAKAQGYKYIAW